MHMLEKMASLKKENAELIVENQELQVRLLGMIHCQLWKISLYRKHDRHTMR